MPVRAGRAGLPSVPLADDALIPVIAIMRLNAACVDGDYSAAIAICCPARIRRPGRADVTVSLRTTTSPETMVAL